MKKIILSIAVAMIMTAAFAQAPQLLSYQSVVRNTAGALVSNTLVGMRISILQGSSSGTAVYVETQTPTTNANGLVSLSVGGGAVVTGSMAGINWAAGPYFIKTETDPTGNTTYTITGISQLQSVPFALYAQSTANTLAGTTNFVSKFTSASSLGNSKIFDNDTVIGMFTDTPSTMAKVEIWGIGKPGVAPVYQTGLLADGPSALSASGVFGQGGWRGVYGYNTGTYAGVEAIGVYGQVTGSSYTSLGYGVKGANTGTGGTSNYGVYGTSTGGGTGVNYGVYGYASGASTNYAGYFAGNVQITGSIAKGSGTFKIDHPLDPENKYLYHSFVESPDMMNIYNGNITTDANGDASVTMPAYFEALNTDFRYQLTVIGTFSQAIISEKIAGNQFRIKTDKPNVEVSWMVTGVRQDKYANAHRVVPEVAKEVQNVGKYLHPLEWGRPASQGIDAPVAVPEKNSAK